MKMNQKTKTYIVFAAALTNIIASIFFADSDIRRFSDPSNVSAALGFWFFATSLILWVVFLVLYFLSKRK